MGDPGKLTTLRVRLHRKHWGTTSFSKCSDMSARKVATMHRMESGTARCDYDFLCKPTGSRERPRLEIVEEDQRR